MKVTLELTEDEMQKVDVSALRQIEQFVLRDWRVEVTDMLLGVPHRGKRVRLEGYISGYDMVTG